MELAGKQESFWKQMSRLARESFIEPFIFFRAPKCPMNYTRKQEWLGRGGKVHKLKREAVHKTLTLEKK